MPNMHGEMAVGLNNNLIYEQGEGWQDAMFKGKILGRIQVRLRLYATTRIGNATKPMSASEAS